MDVQVKYILPKAARLWPDILSPLTTLSSISSTTMPSPPSQELAKRPAGQLMPPPPPPKRIKRPATVLEEDVYASTLSHVIARDFFPGLLETQSKQEYLDAIESKDKAWIASSKKKLADVMRTPTPGSNARRKLDATPTPHFGRPEDTPHATPHGWGGDTPMSVVSNSTTTETSTGPDVSNMGLLGFQSKYTSDDNESFYKVVDKQNEKKREKYPWLWNDNKIPSARQIAHSKQESQRMIAAGGNPETSLIPIKTDLDARPARPDAWKSKPDNTLMFLPSSVEDTHETHSQRAERTSRAAPKRILYQNTRLPDPEAVAAANSIPPSPSISAIQDAIAGRPRLDESEVYTGSETPRVNGYAFVDEDEPETPEHAKDDEIDWRLLGSVSSERNPFQLAEAGKREALHHRMVDRVARKKRDEKAAQAKTPISSPFAKGNATPGKMLTPAAQKLLNRVGTPRAKSSVIRTPRK
ncbi:unnamed protein product [Penicillium olsonii]|uniref:Nuclear protein DGCR14 n=1 Tax=Penicillium olsonii TaxID=99116 RepID=A0A9W4I3P2_PENOL|nr:unnamed protein product [Penicillium olsonii]CAG8210390.1 unnamed protein product [Penicillium olsonii]